MLFFTHMTNGESVYWSAWVPFVVVFYSHDKWWICVLISMSPPFFYSHDKWWVCVLISTSSICSWVFTHMTNGMCSEQHKSCLLGFYSHDKWWVCTGQHKSHLLLGFYSQDNGKCVVSCMSKQGLAVKMRSLTVILTPSLGPLSFYPFLNSLDDLGLVQSQWHCPVEKVKVKCYNSSHIFST